MNHLSNFTYQYGVYTCFLLALYATLFTLETHACIMNNVQLHILFPYVIMLCSVDSFGYIAIGNLVQWTALHGYIAIGKYVSNSVVI